MLLVEISTASEISTDSKFLKFDASSISPLFPSIVAQKALILEPFEVKHIFATFLKKLRAAIGKYAMFPKNAKMR